MARIKMHISKTKLPFYLPCEVKGAFVLGENDFRKSFSPFSACLAVTENIIFWKMTSGWPIFSPLTRKSVSPLIFTSNNFRKKREREERAQIKEREREERATIALARSTIDDQRSMIAIDDRRSMIAIDEIAPRNLVDLSMRSRGAINECARRMRIAHRRSSDAHRSSARSKNWLHFFCWVLVSFAWFDAFSVKIFEWTNLNLLVLF